MADITHNDPLVTESKLTEFYEDIKPFLGCPAYVTQEGDEMYFSSDEKVVGRWTDGKPVYQKVISGIVVSGSTTTTISVTPSGDNIDNIIYTEYLRYSYNGSVMKSVTQAASTLNSTYKNQVDIYVGGQSGSSTGHVIICYTKVADSAATTIEQKPTHYSTDEQVVGTWIDGKPLYQKTIVSKTASTANAWVQIPIGASIDLAMLKDLTVPAGGAGVIANATVDFFYPSVGEDLSTYIRAVVWTNRENSDSKNKFGVYSKFTSAVPFYATIQYTKTTD